MTVLVIPGRAYEPREARLDAREPGISRNNPWIRLEASPRPGMTCMLKQDLQELQNNDLKEETCGLAFGAAFRG
jgi:hypothetical protein